jgi:hypothetical protein
MDQSHDTSNHSALFPRVVYTELCFTRYPPPRHLPEMEVRPSLCVGAAVIPLGTEKSILVVWIRNSVSARPWPCPDYLRQWRLCLGFLYSALAVLDCWYITNTVTLLYTRFCWVNFLSICWMLIVLSFWFTVNIVIALKKNNLVFIVYYCGLDTPHHLGRHLESQRRNQGRKRRLILKKEG